MRGRKQRGEMESRRCACIEERREASPTTKTCERQLLSLYSGSAAGSEGCTWEEERVGGWKGQTMICVDGGRWKGAGGITCTRTRS